MVLNKNTITIEKELFKLGAEVVYKELKSKQAPVKYLPITKTIQFSSKYDWTSLEDILDRTVILTWNTTQKEQNMEKNPKTLKTFLKVGAGFTLGVGIGFTLLIIGLVVILGILDGLQTSGVI
jgi:uncharacterized membrane protein